MGSSATREIERYWQQSDLNRIEKVVKGFHKHSVVPNFLTKTHQNARNKEISVQ